MDDATRSKRASEREGRKEGRSGPVGRVPVAFFPPHFLYRAPMFPASPGTTNPFCSSLTEKILHVPRSVRSFIGRRPTVRCRLIPLFPRAGRVLASFVHGSKFDSIGSRGPCKFLQARVSPSRRPREFREIVKREIVRAFKIPGLGVRLGL